MYKVYVIKQRRGGSEVLNDTRTSTPSREAAITAFRLAWATPYTQDHLLLLTHDGEKLAVHRYGSMPGDPNYVDIATLV